MRGLVAITRDKLEEYAIVKRWPGISKFIQIRRNRFKKQNTFGHPYQFSSHLLLLSANLNCATATAMTALCL